MLGPADDGGWWVLGLRDPAGAAALRDVPMSTPTTYDDTRARAGGRRAPASRPAPVLRDVDTVADADLVAPTATGDTEFAAGLGGGVRR